MSVGLKPTRSDQPAAAWVQGQKEMKVFFLFFDHLDAMMVWGSLLSLLRVCSEDTCNEDLLSSVDYRLFDALTANICGGRCSHRPLPT